MVVVLCEVCCVAEEVFCGVLWCLRGCGQPEIPTNVRLALILLCLEMIPGGLATFLKGSLRGTRLRRRGEPSGLVVAEDVAFRGLLFLLVSFS